MKEWLPESDSVLNDDPLIEFQGKQKGTFYQWFADKEFLYHEYVEKEKSAAQIAREVGCAKSTISAYLLEFSIQLREMQPKHRPKGQLAFVKRSGRVGLCPTWVS